MLNIITFSPSQTQGDGIHSPGKHSKCFGLHLTLVIDFFDTKKSKHLSVKQYKNY